MLSGQLIESVWNNNRGGYNAGDEGENAANNENQQYRMQYFQSGAYKLSQANGEPEGQSFLTLEWTNQHGCGGTEDTDPHKMNCNLVLQYMCQEEPGSNEDDDIRNGQTQTRRTTINSTISTKMSTRQITESGTPSRTTGVSTSLLNSMIIVTRENATR
ncbi:hypothetical protein BSL78_29566, partial [Apostichopus japonicus]